jgi:hypothetical protein
VDKRLDHQFRETWTFETLNARAMGVSWVVRHPLGEFNYKQQGAS